MYTLFIDTHYKNILIYLYKDNSLVGKKEVLDVVNTSTLIMPNIDELIKEKNLEIKDVNKVAVCVGPGSFTGTRIGVTIAKVLAYSLNIPIVTLTSLDLIGLNLDEESYVGVEENNGYFICKYNKKQIGDITYMKSKDYDEFIVDNEVITEIQINENKLINFINELKEENAFNVNPIYVKTIEALNDK